MTGSLRAVAAELAGTPRPRVAVLGPTAPRRLAGPLAAALPAAEIRVLRTADRTVEQAHVWLAAGGPFDAVVDHADADVAQRFPRFLFHVRPGGIYVLRSRGPDDQNRLRRLVTWLRELEQRRDRGARRPRVGDPRPPEERDRDALAWSVERVEVGAEHVAVRHRARPLATLRDRQANRLLELRGRADDILASVPAAALRSRAAVRTSGGAASLLPGELPAPGLHLRRWADVACHPEQIAVQADLLLPASLPGRIQGRLAHPSLARWAPGFVSRPPPADLEELPGVWYYLDNVKRGHFGHALSEQLSLTWGWAPALAQQPALRALVSGRPGDSLGEWELQLFEAAGIPRERVRMVTRPVRVETLVTATPMFSRPDYVHPEIVSTYAAVGRRLAADATRRTWPDRVFLTRAPGKRGCLNAAEVEDLHRRHGFAVVRPETLPLPDQVRLVREASVISGFAGSGMFHSALTGAPKHVIVITHEAYPAHNEQMFAAVLGHRLDLVVARPDVPPGPRFDRRSFHSTYTLDLQREGAFLRQVLAELPAQNE
jgi:hypothetical protein